MFYAQHTSHTKLPTTSSSGALLCHLKKKQGSEGEVRGGVTVTAYYLFSSPQEDSLQRAVWKGLKCEGQ